ncbi:MAG TPA: M56 family metallopeptidase [Bryobacteraceae bacterium]|nr:M56 family metallopeptidase [Bryobacteraceae bacterium]
MLDAAITNHLLQSTAFALATAGLCWLLRRQAARIRFWVWLAASLKFLLPFSALVWVGQTAEPPAPSIRSHAVAVERVEQAIFPAVTPATTPARRVAWRTGLGTVWLAGFVVLVAWRVRQWMELRRALRIAMPVDLHLTIPVYETTARLEPGVAGLMRPILLLPLGLRNSLPPTQFDAILAHELCHVRERDNITALLHMVVEALFWFHPLVWWVGARMIEERERACDESVIRQGNEREAYARGVLNVCEHYAASPLPCAAGITGSDLKQRIREIMTATAPIPLSATRRIALGALGLTAVLGPVTLGIVRGQTAPEKYQFEVASIRPSQAGGRGTHININNSQFTTRNTPLLTLIQYAYGMQDYQLAGVPDWAKERRFDITAKFDTAEDLSDTAREGSRNERIRARVRNLLAERFQLVLREGKKDLPVYKLVEDRNGHKLKAAAEGGGSMNVSQNNGSGTLQSDGFLLPGLAVTLSGILGRPVRDETGIGGRFSAELRWMGDDAAAQGPTIFTALREQLGLRLESGKGPVVTYAIERAALPSEN